MAMWIKGSNNVLSIEDYDGTQGGVQITVKDGKLTLNGTSTGVVEKFLPLKITIPAGTYTMDGGKVGRGFSLYLCKAVNNYADRLNIFNSWYSSGIVTVNGNYDYTSLMVYYPTNVTFNNVTIDLMLAKGETALPYEPYYPAQRVKAVFKSKNLIPFPYITDSIELGGVAITVNNDGTITLNGECTEAFWFVLRNKSENPPYMIEAGTYTLSGTTQDGMVLYITDNTKQINHYNWSNRPVTFTFDEQQALYMQIRGYAGHTFDNVVLKPMLNKGTTPLPYETYFPLTKFKAIPKSRNLFSYPYKFTEATTSDGLATFIANADGSISVKKNGEIAVPTPVIVITNIDIKKAGKYSLNDNTEGISFFLGYYVGGKWISNRWNTFEVTEEEIEQGVTVQILICATPSLAGDIIFYPMLNKGDPLPYEPPQEIWL